MDWRQYLSQFEPKLLTVLRQGYGSIGCMPCTEKVAPGEDPRSGRWKGRGKTECGLHPG